jgi:hypothetical protein
MTTILGIGQMVLIRFRGLDGVAQDIQPDSDAWWFAWKGDPQRGSLLVVRNGGETLPRASRLVTAGHERFHGAAPDGWLAAHWSPPSKVVHRLGLAMAVRYRVPPGMQSNKQGHDYHHSFGDFGRGDDRSNDPRYWPVLLSDSRGHLFFRRRAGNVYHLQDWMRG